MAERDREKPLRLFVALTPAEALRARIAAVLDALVRGDRAGAVRWTRADQVHLTLRFLGATAPERVPALEGALDGIAADTAPLELAVGGCGAFPDWRRPRVVWLGIEANQALAALARRTEEAVTALGYAPEDRPFRPHLTLGRVRQGRRAGNLEEAARAAASDPPVPWRVESLALYESHLAPEGAVYRALRRAPFAAGEDAAPASR